jgi:23S rRNA (guanosine2251-2'-O)-methyltransferase
MPGQPDHSLKKARFDRMLTVYGRKAALESLQNDALDCRALHLARSNREEGIITEIRQCAEARGIPVRLHTREELARISRNGRQDQGVAVDIQCPSFRHVEDYLATPVATPRRILALDGITNPQNLGMIIRSATAGCIDGIVIPRKGTAALGPLVIKASAGTIYRAPLLLCQFLPGALQLFRKAGARICALEAGSPHSLFDYHADDFCVYVLGNESEGLSPQSRELADISLSVPMRNGVESLNVAVTASLVAFGGYLER